MKIKSKIIFFIALISLFYSVSLIQSTYAKYLSSASANANLTIARWDIKINNHDIIENSNFSESITPTFAGTENIKEGVIAPTAEGYFDITIDGTNTDVSFNYTLDIIHSENNTITDLQLTKYELDGEEFPVSENITGTINFDDALKVKTIRFYVSWVDDDSQTMDNALDTESTINGNAAFDVNLNLIQVNNNPVEETPEIPDTPETPENP